MASAESDIISAPICARRAPCALRQTGLITKRETNVRITRHGCCRVAFPAPGRSRARRRFRGRGRRAGAGAAVRRAAGGSGPCCGGVQGAGGAEMLADVHAQGVAQFGPAAASQAHTEEELAITVSTCRARVAGPRAAAGERGLIRAAGIGPQHRGGVRAAQVAAQLGAGLAEHRRIVACSARSNATLPGRPGTARRRRRVVDNSGANNKSGSSDSLRRFSPPHDRPGFVLARAKGAGDGRGADGRPADNWY